MYQQCTEMKTLMYVFLLNGVLFQHLTAQNFLKSDRFTVIYQSENIRFETDKNEVSIPLMGKAKQRGNNSVLVWVQDPQTDERALLPKRLSDGNSLLSVLKTGKARGTDSLCIYRRQWITDTLDITINFLVLRRNVGNGSMRRDEFVKNMLLRRYLYKNPFIVPERGYFNTP